DLHRARALVVHEDLALAITGRALGTRILERHRGDDRAARGIDGHAGTCRPAVLREDDAIGEIVVHDAVEPTGGDRDLLDYGEAPEIEHGYSRVAGAGDEAVPRLGRQGDAVIARRVRDIAEHLAGRAVDHHHVRAAGNEHPSGAQLCRQVIGAAVAADAVLGD